MIELRVYAEPSGRTPFLSWLDGLDTAATAKIRRALAQLEAGNWSEVKSIGGGVMERRIFLGPGFRVYFGRDGDRLVILLGGGTKSAQQRDIMTVQARWRDYKSRR